MGMASNGNKGSEGTGPLDGLGALLNDLHSSVKEGVQHVELAFSSLVAPPGRPLSIVREDESPSTDPRGDLAARFPRFDPTARPGVRADSSPIRQRRDAASTPRSGGGSNNGSFRSVKSVGSVKSVSSAGSGTSRGSDEGFKVRTEKEKFEAMLQASRASEVQEARLARSCQAMSEVRMQNAKVAKPAVHVRESGKSGKVSERVNKVKDKGNTLHSASCRCQRCKELLSHHMQTQLSSEAEKAQLELDLSGIGGVRWR